MGNHPVVYRYGDTFLRKCQKGGKFGYGASVLYFGFFAVYCQFHTISVYEFTCKYKELLFDRMV
jgi:hypothetical protein